MSKVFKWCKKGCGKKVIFRPLTVEQRNGGKSYVCESCGTRYKREEVDKTIIKATYIPSRKIPSISKIVRMVNKYE